MIEAIDIFSCTGILAGGLAAGGVKVLCGFELDPVRADQFRANVGPCVEGDIFEDLSSLNDFHGIDLALICPPCQGFSSAGKRDPDDPRNDALRRVPEIVERVMPRWFMVENVARAHYIGETAPVVEKIQALGYVTRDGITQLADYGLPQLREHWFLWGALDGHPIEPPPRTHGQRKRTGQLELGLEPWVPCGGIVERGRRGIPEDKLILWASRRYLPRRHRDRVRALYPRVPLLPREHDRNQYTTVIVDPETDLLPRVTGSFGRSGDCFMIDGDVIRFPLFEEACRAQDVAEGWSLGPTHEQAWQQIGDATPARFGRAIAEMLGARG